MCILLYINFYRVYIILYYFQFYSLDYNDFCEDSKINEQKSNTNNITNNNIINKNNENNIKNNKKINENESSSVEKSLKEEIRKLKEENNKLKNELLKANKIIDNLKNELNKNIPNNNEINNLKNIIIIKDNEINKLKNELENEKNKNENQFVNYKDIMIIYFTSTDQIINKHAIKCLKTDTFAEVEEKLYRQYEEHKFRETNNTFLVNGGTILRFKKLYENKIKDGNVIQLIKNE